MALFSITSTLSVAGVTVLLRTALATVDVGMLIDVGKAQMTGFSRNLAAISIGRISLLFDSRILKHTSKPDSVTSTFCFKIHHSFDARQLTQCAC